MNHTRSILVALENINRALTHIETFVGDKLSDNERARLAEVIRDCYTATNSLKTEVSEAEQDTSVSKICW
jgi:uncharacterized protein YbgA (DUF1722 family)